MDILLSTFVNKYINKLDESTLVELENFLDFEDEIILNFYNYNIVEKKIDRNKSSMTRPGLAVWRSTVVSCRRRDVGCGVVCCALEVQYILRQFTQLG